MEKILALSAGRFAVGDEISLADCFLVPQIRNALLAEINLATDFPNLARIWNNTLAVPEVDGVIQAAGGKIQPLAFDAEKFEVYVAREEAGPS